MRALSFNSATKIQIIIDIRNTRTHFLTQSQENCSFFDAKSSLVTKYAKIVTKKSTHIRVLPLFFLQPVRDPGSPM